VSKTDKPGIIHCYAQLNVLLGFQTPAVQCGWKLILVKEQVFLPNERKFKFQLYVYIVLEISPFDQDFGKRLFKKLLAYAVVMYCN